MTEFFTFVELGIRHIADIQAMDHMLFLFALAAIYRFSDYREVVKVVTAFTVGHSISLAAAVLGFMPLNAPLVEFLIPVTIVATCIENIVVRNEMPRTATRRYRPVFASLFGVVHGAGFANYLSDLFTGEVALPLLGFNVGIELGQVGLLAAAFAAIAAIDWTLTRLTQPALNVNPVRVRTVAISSIVLVTASQWAFQRVPW